MYRHFRTDERLTAVLKMTVAILRLKRADFYKYFNVKYSLFACNCQNNVQSLKQVHRLLNLVKKKDDH